MSWLLQIVLQWILRYVGLFSYSFLKVYAQKWGCFIIGFTILNRLPEWLPVSLVGVRQDSHADDQAPEEEPVLTLCETEGYRDPTEKVCTGLGPSLGQGKSPGLHAWRRKCWDSSLEYCGRTTLSWYNLLDHSTETMKTKLFEEIYLHSWNGFRELVGSYVESQ